MQPFNASLCRLVSENRTFSHRFRRKQVVESDIVGRDAEYVGPCSIRFLPFVADDRDEGLHPGEESVKTVPAELLSLVAQFTRRTVFRREFRELWRVQLAGFSTATAAAAATTGTTWHRVARML